MSMLYLISADSTKYDTYDSAVVVADSEEEARLIHPDGESTYPSHNWNSTWQRPEKVHVGIVGIPDDKWKKGDVVCSSFNAG